MFIKCMIIIIYLESLKKIEKEDLLKGINIYKDSLTNKEQAGAKRGVKPKYLRQNS